MSESGHKTIFLDRDGTLLEEVDFLSRLEDLRLFTFTKEAVQMLRSAGYRLVVITNQSGIARGFYGEVEMHAIHRQIQIELDNSIDAFYFCPHLPDAGCECRKPNLQMIKNAERDSAVDFANSWVIGDKDLDVLTGIAASMSTALVRTGYGRTHEAALQQKSTFVADDLLEAAKRIVDGE
jgi:D-glycero-D-manno-heptose 1,7-bisphosphate phosphatase